MIAFVPFSKLQEGDEFIRITMRPVLIRDIKHLIVRQSEESLSITLSPGRIEVFRIRHMVRNIAGELIEEIA